MGRPAGKTPPPAPSTAHARGGRRRAPTARHRPRRAPRWRNHGNVRENPRHCTRALQNIAGDQGLRGATPPDKGPAPTTQAMQPRPMQLPGDRRVAPSLSSFRKYPRGESPAGRRGADSPPATAGPGATPDRRDRADHPESCLHQRPRVVTGLCAPTLAQAAAQVGRAVHLRGRWHEPTRLSRTPDPTASAANHPTIPPPYARRGPAHPLHGTVAGRRATGLGKTVRAGGPASAAAPRRSARRPRG